MTQMYTIIRDLFKRNPNIKPVRPIPVEFPDMDAMSGNTAVWFGHSAVLLQIEGKRVLLDPMFANSPSPFPLIGGKRFSRVLPIAPERLPFIDAVILSHDHYDHLDYKSILRLKDKTALFCVPLGVGKRLKEWGVSQDKVREFEWWQALELAGLTLACTPAQHFSGRGLFDRNATLWCSWAIIGQKVRVYFSGDGGYGPHFTDIGDKYGPFDLTLMECGQYDKRWADIHMMPEETVQAHLDVKGKLLIPIHWAAFSLAFHGWTDPIERVTKAAKAQNINISTPKIGEPVIIDAASYPASVWWKGRQNTLPAESSTGTCR